MDIDGRKHIEKIIIFLKMVENDYRIDLTPEMEWLRGLQQAKDEPSADLEKAATEYTFTTPSTIHEAFVAGAKWMEKQFEKVEGEPVSKDLEEAAIEYADNNRVLGESKAGIAYNYYDIMDAYIAGAEYMKDQFEKVEGYELDWFSHHDHEYMCGFRFDEPVELPCEIFIKRKETL